MGSELLLLGLVIFDLCCSSAGSTRIKIVNNGYEDIVVALPPNIAVKDRSGVVTAIQNLFQKTSPLLSIATKSRATFSSVTILVPPQWTDTDSWLPDKGKSVDDAAAAISRDDADILVSSSNGEEHPYVLHQGGCGRRALRIYLPFESWLKENSYQKDAQFLRLWSEFRYGIFPERGFDNDEKYPAFYQFPGETEKRISACSSTEVYGPSSTCREYGRCEEQLNTTISFCEGYLSMGRRHNPDAPSKHNLLCNEEGTWYTVLRSPDFQGGRNAAPKHPSMSPEVTFRYVREPTSPRIIVAIDVSARMSLQNRYPLTKNAFSHFVISVLPDDSELSLVVFGDKDNFTLLTPFVHLTDMEAKTNYLESLDLPEEPSDGNDVCLDCVMEEIIEMVQNENSSFASAPAVILITAKLNIDSVKFGEIKETLQQSEIRLHAMTFSDEESRKVESGQSLYELCLEADHSFVNLDGDILGNLYRGFTESIKGNGAKVQILQKYLATLDEENIHLQFYLDQGVFQSLEVSLSGPVFLTSPLEYKRTVLVGPDGTVTTPRKMEVVPSWNFQLLNAKDGMYTLKTRRKDGGTSPVLVSILGVPALAEDHISVRVWVESSKFKATPPPVQIFVEVKRGQYPIKNVTVVASVHHPGSGDVSQVLLVDDGLGSVDITKEDGVYSHYFVNFTTVGFYNVLVKVSGGIGDTSAVMRGPTSDCCGSIFTSTDQDVTGIFQREAGPATFEITPLPQGDPYPPVKVTDLRVAKPYDQIVALQWSAVGDNLDTGVAAFYELKLFRDRSTLRSRFNGSDLELYSERIETTSAAEYGTTLYHVVQFPDTIGKGVYYFAIRAWDDNGNYGEPSNTVAVWVETKRNATGIDCTDNPVSERFNVGNSIEPFTHFVIIAMIIRYSLHTYTLTM